PSSNTSKPFHHAQPLPTSLEGSPPKRHRLCCCPKRTASVHRIVSPHRDKAVPAQRTPCAQPRPAGHALPPLPARPQACPPGPRGCHGDGAAALCARTRLGGLPAAGRFRGAGRGGAAAAMERYGEAPLSAVPVADFRQNEGSLTSTLRTLLFFTALMITLPVGLYFSSKAYIFEGTLGMSDRDSYFYAAIVAVVTVHVVLALFVYVAWNEGSRQWREGKQD
uniref:Vacuolar ATPase assembly factor VMA21 n=2 Tax=Falco TaxID=8952 RepID=A0A8C4U1L9_FALTI